MPVVGQILHRCGAFFVKRSFGDDALFPALVKEYIEQLVEKGMNVSVFIEGGRSRTGKLLAPRYGILKNILEAFLDGRASDVWLCPISLQYDRVVETDAYISELLGRPKEKESLMSMLSSLDILQLKLGRVDVRFKEPWSLREFVDRQVARRGDSGVTFGTSTQRDRVTLLRTLGYTCLSHINEVAVIMPAALVGSVILTLRGRGVGRSELVRRVRWLIEAIRARGGRVVDFAGMDLENVVDKALIVLKDLIGMHDDLLEPTFYAIGRFELSFYRNQIIHLFVQEALLSAALYTRVKAGGTAPSQRMPLALVHDELAFLSDILRSEFVYATEGLRINTAKTIDSLAADRVVLVEDDLIGLHPHEREIGRENYGPSSRCSPACDLVLTVSICRLLLLPGVAVCRDVLASRRVALCPHASRVTTARVVRSQRLPSRGAASRQDTLLPGRPVVPRGDQPGDSDERVRTPAADRRPRGASLKVWHAHVARTRVGTRKERQNWRD